jgi:hypothetical protein
LSAARDFWLSCGHHLLDRDTTGKLLVTDEFLKAYLARPELVPPPEACPAEQRLHKALLSDPRQRVSASQLAAISDADARENWQMMIAWRDQLLEHRTLEATYLEIVRRNIKVPHVFLGHLTQTILRNALDDCDDALVLRAAEMFFRPQKLRVQEGSVIAVDEETEAPLSQPSRSPLLALLGLPTDEVEMLSDKTANSYWERSDRFDFALDLTAGRRGLVALSDVFTRWVWHLLAINVTIEPLTELRNAPLSWYVGLDADATRIGDAVWDASELDDAMRVQMVSLFRLTFRNPADIIEKIRGEPVYMFVAMTADGMLRLKPQNLISGLPVRHEEAVN